MSRWRRFATRRLWTAGAVALVLLLSGCVYLRLLEFKLQLSKFDENFAVRANDGLVFLCQHPVIRTGDIRWFGVKPETSERLGHAEQWRVRWVKQLPPGVTEKIEYDIVIELGFADDKMNRVAIPEKYFAFMPKAFLLGVIKSFGRGKVDESDKAVRSSVTAPEVASARPKLTAVDHLLGVPTERRTEGSTIILRYRYVPATKESRAGVFDMVLHFDSASGALMTWQAVTPVGKLGLNFASSTPPDPGSG